MDFSDKRVIALTRFIAGFLEKISVASLAVGLFQGNFSGLLIGTVALIVSAATVYILEGKE